MCALRSNPENNEFVKIACLLLKQTQSLDEIAARSLILSTLQVVLAASEIQARQMSLCRVYKDLGVLCISGVTFVLIV